MVELDDSIRSAVQTLVADAAEPPSWDRVQATKARLRRRRNVTIGAGLLVFVLVAVAVAGRVNQDGQTVVAGSAGSGTAGLPCEAWIAVHTLLDSSVNPGASRSMVASVTAEQAAFLVKSGDVPDRVAGALGGNAVDLAAHVVARPNTNLGTIEITAWADEPARARQLADAFAEALLVSVSDIQEREIDRQRDVLNAAISQLERDLGGVTGTDRSADAARERLTSEISQKRIQLQELDQQAAQGSNIYSFGSSEAFQVTGGQLDLLLSRQTTSAPNEPGTRNLGPVAERTTTTNRPGC